MLSKGGRRSHFFQSRIDKSAQNNGASQDLHIDPEHLTPLTEIILWTLLQGRMKDAEFRIPGKVRLPLDSSLIEMLQKLEPFSSSGIPLPSFIVLTKTLIGRKCGSLPDDYHFDVYSGKILGGLDTKDGCFGNIETISTTLKLHADKTITYHASKKNVGKIIPELPPSKSKPIMLSLQELVEKECNLSRRVYPLHVKMPTFFDIEGKPHGVFILRQIAGNNLEKFFQFDLMDKGKKHNNIATMDRLKISRAFLRAMKTQVHLNKIAHRDIKPANIILGMDQCSKRWRITIIDYGLSGDALIDDQERGRGTPLYGSPEMFDGEPITQQSDIFGAAWMLALLWRADSNPSKDMLQAAMFAHSCKFSNLFSGIHDLNDTADETPLNLQPKQAIQSLLYSMASCHPDARASLDEGIHVFDEIILERTVAATDKHKKSLMQTHRAAVSLRGSLDQFAAEPHPRFIDFIEKMRELFIAGVEKLSDRELQITYFLDCLDIDELAGFHRKEQIMSYVNFYLDDYIKQYGIFCDLYREVQELLASSSNNDEPRVTTITPEMLIELQKVKLKMEHVMTKNSGYLTLDRIAENGCSLTRKNTDWQLLLRRCRPASSSMTEPDKYVKAEDPDADYLILKGPGWGGEHKIRLFHDYAPSFQQSCIRTDSTHVKPASSDSIITKHALMNSDDSDHSIESAHPKASCSNDKGTEAVKPDLCDSTYGFFKISI